MAGPYGTFLYGGDVYGGQPVLDAFNYELGTYEGRIKPENAEPTDGDFIFCLGSDKLPAQVHDLAIGNNVYIEQSIDLTDVNFVRATWRVRQPSALPFTTAIPAPAVIVGDVLPLVGGPAGDSLMAVRSTSTDIFTASSVRRTIRIAGATNGGNNGDKVVTGVLSPRIAIVDAGIVADENPLGAGGGTATMIGARWRASVFVGGIERAWVTQYPGRDVTRVALQAHVSKLAGAQTVRFRLQLEEA